MSQPQTNNLQNATPSSITLTGPCISSVIFLMICYGLPIILVGFSLRSTSHVPHLAVLWGILAGLSIVCLLIGAWSAWRGDEMWVTILRGSMPLIFVMGLIFGAYIISEILVSSAIAVAMAVIFCCVLDELYVALTKKAAKAGGRNEEGMVTISGGVKRLIPSVMTTSFFSRVQSDPRNTNNSDSIPMTNVNVDASRIPGNLNHWFSKMAMQPSQAIATPMEDEEKELLSDHDIV